MLIIIIIIIIIIIYNFYCVIIINAQYYPFGLHVQHRASCNSYISPNLIFYFEGCAVRSSKKGQKFIFEAIFSPKSWSRFPFGFCVCVSPNFPIITLHFSLKTPANMRGSLKVWGANFAKLRADCATHLSSSSSSSSLDRVATVAGVFLMLTPSRSRLLSAVSRGDESV